MPSLHLLIKGKVQGVFFRASARDEAEKLGITGWVKNTREGDVEIMANGSELALEKFTDWCRIGPQMAHVTDVIVNEVQEGGFNDFRITR